MKIKSENFLEHIKNKENEFGKVKNIDLKVSELYPFVDGVVTEEDSIKGQDGEVYLEGSVGNYEGINYPSPWPELHALQVLIVAHITNGAH